MTMTLILVLECSLDLWVELSKVQILRSKLELENQNLLEQGKGKIININTKLLKHFNRTF